LFHTSKTAKMIKVILLSSTLTFWQGALSNITFIIFAVFDVQNNAQLPLTALKFFFYYDIYHQRITPICHLRHRWSSQPTSWVICSLCYWMLHNTTTSEQFWQYSFLLLTTSELNVPRGHIQYSPQHWISTNKFVKLHTMFHKMYPLYFDYNFSNCCSMLIKLKSLHSVGNVLVYDTIFICIFINIFCVAFNIAVNKTLIHSF